jgi:hypothetical protein
MTQQQHGKLMAGFEQIFALFCVLMTEICISLFFHFSASKMPRLLITANASKTNRIQREFDSNVRIATQELVSYSTLFAKLTNLFKQFALLSVLRVSAVISFC